MPLRSVGRVLRSSPLRRGALAVAVIAAAGCGAPFVPGEPTGVLVLHQLDGAPPPVRPSPEADYEILAETLWFAPDGTGSRRQTIRNLASGNSHAWTGDVTWTLQGARLSMWAYCPPYSLVACPSEPTLSGSYLEGLWQIDQALSARTPMTFRIIDLPSSM